MLLNAVFFEASWRTMFDPQLTEDANFTTISGAVTQVSTMVVQSTFSVKDVEDLEARVLELPYRGGNYSFFVILPNAQNGLAEMENKLDGPILERAVKRMPPDQLYRVYLPKFTLRLQKNLNEVLQTLGLGSMFDAQRANFSDMVSDAAGVIVSDVLHETLIEVKESGTKAAAVTSVGIIPTSIVLPQLFRGDHPFLFLLRDKVNEVNIFMGRVTDPPQNSTSVA